MGSLSRAALAACIVLSGVGAQSSGAGNTDALSLQSAGSRAITLHVKKRHPSSRETVAGPWPRFAKNMLA